jgi:outer membrane protein OmpA-like peptidoglycan-associated protein
MRKIFPLLLLASSFLSACSSMPSTTPMLEQARADFVTAQNTPQVATYAKSEMQAASDALMQANAAATERESAARIDQLAYLAKQKIATTQEIAKQKAAEASVADSGKQRDAIRLEQRTNEADRAKQSAEQAKQSAEQATLAAQVAQGQTAQAEQATQDAQAKARQLQAQLNDLRAKQTERGMVITIGDVLFATDQSHLTPAGEQSVQVLANVLQQNPQRTVLIEGFTDSTGTSDYNQQLSNRRASAVRNSLQAMGIATSRIAIRAFGEAYPVATNDTAANRQLNRRVEIVLSDDTGRIAMR